jgi:2-dehydro-3-deoxyphosphogluconate aldolase/(4S)-4-hydroxy-2-oxoglutarate aldolase
VADAEAALDAGARFGVSPGYTADRGHACRNLGLPLLPGVATASEVMAASADGYDFLKFFPATAAGGVPMLKALGGAVPRRRVLPHRRHHARQTRRSTWRCPT